MKHENISSKLVFIYQFSIFPLSLQNEVLYIFYVEQKLVVLFKSKNNDIIRKCIYELDKSFTSNIQIKKKSTNTH